MINKLTAILQSLSLQNSDTVIVACSGGSDSMALAALLGYSNYFSSANVILAHVRHNIRSVEETVKDSHVIETAAHQFGFITEYHSITTQDLSSSLGFEAAARNQRYQFFNKLAQKYQAKAIFLAHTADDQIETVYMRLIRKSGVSGLKGIPGQRGLITRPLLSFTKEELKQFLLENKILWHEDHTNNDEKYLRNKVRSQLTKLTFLEPSLPAALVSLGQKAAEVQNLIHYLLQEQKSLTICNDNSVSFPLEHFVNLPYLLQKELLFQWFDQLQHGCLPPDFRLPERFFRHLNFSKQYPVITRGYGIILLKKKKMLIMQRV